MKSPLTGFKSVIFLFALTVITIGLIFAPRSTAKSDPHGGRTNSPRARVQDEKGTIVAQLKEYDPTLHGYGFRNYGPNNELEKAILRPGDLIKIFGAENVCQSGR